MSCEEALEMMQRKLDKDLTPAEEAALNTHLSHCTSCLTEWRQYERLSHLLDELPKVTPPRSVMDQVALAIKREKKRPLDRKKGWVAVVMAACLLLALALLWKGDRFPFGSPYAGEEETTEGHSTSFIAQDSALEAGQPEKNPPDAPLVGEAAEGPLGMGQIEALGETESMVLQEGERIWSPDGKYSAYIGPDGEDLRIDVLIDGQMQPYYISINPESKDWVITEMKWLDGDRLYYVLYHQEKGEYQYWIIAASQLKERQLDGPVEEGVHLPAPSP